MPNPSALPTSVKNYLASPRPMLINGVWHSPENAALIDCIDPATAERIGTVYAAGGDQVEAAVTAARHSFTDKRWRAKTPAEKARILWRVGDLIEQHADTLAFLETLDGGKPLTAARQGEIPAAAESFRYYAGWCTKLGGRTTDISIPGDFHAYTRREPVGVVGLITPWNGPLVMAAWKIAPALAAGCSVIIKPAEVTCLSTLYLGELLIEAGLPDGVVNILPGNGAAVGAALVQHPQVNKVSFTGSTATGKKLVQAATGNLKKLTLELGGKSPVIVYNDADLEKTISGVAQGIFSNSGQVCVAGSRVFVEAGIYDDLLGGLINYAENLVIGPGLDPATEMGPLISDQQLNSVRNYVDSALQEGASLVTGGKKLNRKGYFMQPTILTGVRPGMRVMKEEIFGPVLSVMKVDDMAKVIALANSSDYGLAGSVWTRDISKAHKIAAEIQAGIFWINCHGIPDMAMPFGGTKQSGWGREAGLEGLEHYTELKSVIAAL
ncbi:aldehyde dehydrogenase family protein [Luteithermobacter gelatinilyticus]|uniref:aldehyde dehydrogenase family protein n=1 Tax=Luteithermobacter gelatinilyticus TaxID=2582913 RepID=UPI001AEFF3B3|nr:aldehyde dehydrogenase family protein [Luteithermobacter gelatinilyticus]